MIKSIIGAISVMWWSFLFFRFSAVHSFVMRTPSVVSLPFGSSRNTRRQHDALRYVPSFGKLRMTNSIATIEKNTTVVNEEVTIKENDKGTMILADADAFIKPDRDPRDYRVIKLKNNLQAMLVSTTQAVNDDDESANVEAASMHIQAGHFDDTLPGLAHFYEHMLVREQLGTKFISLFLNTFSLSRKM